MGKCHWVTNEVDANECREHISFSVFTSKEESTTILSLSADFLFLKTSQEKKIKKGEK